MTKETVQEHKLNRKGPHGTAMYRSKWLSKFRRSIPILPFCRVSRHRREVLRDESDSRADIRTFRQDLQALIKSYELRTSLPFYLCDILFSS